MIKFSYLNKTRVLQRKLEVLKNREQTSFSMFWKLEVSNETSRFWLRQNFTKCHTQVKTRGLYENLEVLSTREHWTFSKMENLKFDVLDIKPDSPFKSKTRGLMNKPRGFWAKVKIQISRLCEIFSFDLKTFQTYTLSFLAMFNPFSNEFQMD